MKAENAGLRGRSIISFTKIYSVLLIFWLFLAYWSFHRVPEMNSADKITTHTYLIGFLKKAAEVRDLSRQILNTPDVKSSSVLAYYEWVGELKENYPREMFVTVFDTYLKQTDEVLNQADPDSVLAALGKEYRLLKSQNTALARENMELNAQLAEKKLLSK